jgi:tetratricopeptide (TPR) repeat protein
MYLFLQTAEGRRRAAPWLERARRAAARDGVGDRERDMVAAFEAWYRGDLERALQRHLDIARRWPRDLLNAKIAQIHQLSLGQRSSMRDLAEYTLAANPGSGYAWGLLAFALEQVGECRAALACGEHAVALNSDDPWAQHAVAHVHEARGAADDGIAWMRSMSERWERCSSFMYTHNWWHLALFHLRRGEPQQTLALYDQRVWGVRKTHVQDQVNAISLLGRAELAGADAGHRWHDLATHALPRIHDRCNPFVDLHFGYALARAGDDAAVGRLLGGVARHAARCTSPLWRDIALPALRGVIAHARGEQRQAVAQLHAVAPGLHRLGGSTAQQAW